MKETLSLLFALFCSMFLAAESFPECSDAREWNLVQADKRSQRLLPPQSGNGFLLELDESVFPYAELQLKKARRLPELREGEFLLTVTLEKPIATKSFFNFPNSQSGWSGGRTGFYSESGRMSRKRAGDAKGKPTGRSTIHSLWPESPAGSGPASATSESRSILWNSIQKRPDRPRWNSPSCFSTTAPDSRSRVGIPFWSRRRMGFCSA